MTEYAVRLAELRHRLADHPLGWVRPLVVGGVLVLSAAIAIAVPPRFLLAIPALVLGLAVVALFLYRPPLGLLAIIASAPIPYDGPSHFNVTMVAVAGLVGLWVVGMILRQGEIRLVPSATMRPLFTLVVVACLAFGVGQLPWYTFARPAPMGAQLGGLSIFLLSAGAFLLTAHQGRDVRWLARMTWLFLALGTLYTAGRFIPPLERQLARLYAAPAAGSMFWAWLVILAAAQALFNRRLSLLWRGALAALAAAALYHGIFQNSDWKSGWVPPAVGVAVLVALASWRSALAVGLGGLTLTPKLATRLIATDAYSYSTRLDAWRIVVEIVKVNPVLGLGPANYHWYTPLFPIRGYAVRFNSHNQYVDLIAQTGLLGLGAFLWFFWEVGRLGWWLRHRVPEGFARAYVHASLAGVAATLVSAMLGDWVLPFFYNVNLGGFRASVLPWLFLGGLVALEQNVREAQPAEATA